MLHCLSIHIRRSAVLADNDTLVLYGGNRNTAFQDAICYSTGIVYLSLSCQTAWAPTTVGLVHAPCDRSAA